jgi:malonate-semialdehyde dehydrogenase (acetylating) / methylmalonate-semialdehyde dehydrogenase
MSQPNIATISHAISGQATTGTSARRQHVTNPATGQVTGQVCLANVADVDTAVAAAKAAERG